MSANGPRDDESDEAVGRMLARTWSIAANFREPADYGIPTAPVFRARSRADGSLVLLAPNGADPVLTAARPVPVRR